MPIAKSGGPIVYSEFTAETRAEWVEAVKARLMRAGWTVYATVTGGYVMLGTSPQSGGPGDLTVRVKIVDDGAADLIARPQATLQMISDVTPTVVSIARHARVFSGATYRIWCNPCQFFIWRPGEYHDSGGASIEGGVPWVAPDESCQGIIPQEQVTEAWWIASDESGAGSARSHPRVSLMAGGPTHHQSPPNYAEACWNGALHMQNAAGQWQILTIKGLQGWSFFDSFGLILSRTLWWDESGLQVEPLLAWGDPGATLGTIRAQLWDSWLTTNQCASDSTFTDLLGDSYLNWTDEYYWGCLQLLLGDSEFPDAVYPNVVY